MKKQPIFAVALEEAKRQARAATVREIAEALKAAVIAECTCGLRTESSVSPRDTYACQACLVWRRMQALLGGNGEVEK